MSVMPKKQNRDKRLTKEDKGRKQSISSKQVINENVIGRIKRFKILSKKYRIMRKRCGLRLI